MQELSVDYLSELPAVINSGDVQRISKEFVSVKYVFDLIGYFGPMIISIISIAKLWKQSGYLYGYLVFSLINFAVNGIVKTIAKQPRPYGGQSIIHEHYVGANKYGMPSGHAQSVFFSMTYLYVYAICI